MISQVFLTLIFCNYVGDIKGFGYALKPGLCEISGFGIANIPVIDRFI
jgi:hypothetical protein